MRPKLLGPTSMYSHTSCSLIEIYRRIASLSIDELNQEARTSTPLTFMRPKPLGPMCMVIRAAY
jgi:hypothetical protein